MKRLDELLPPLREAWNLLLDIPFPPIFPGPKGDTDSEEAPSVAVLTAFPVVGAILGVGASLLAWFFLLFLHNAATAIILSIVLTLFFEMVSSFRYLKMTAIIADAVAQRASIPDVLANLDDIQHQEPGIATSLVVFSVFLCRLLAFAVLIYYRQSIWIMVTLTLAYTLQASLAFLDDSRTSQPLFEVDDEGDVHYPWLVAGVIVLFLGISCIHAGAVALILTWLLSRGLSKFFNNNFAGVTPALIGFSGYITEIVLLLFGVALLIRA